jgi:hypothetical protein
VSDLSYVIKVPEPVLSADEMSAAIGRLTMACESLRADIVALEGLQFARAPSLRKRVKKWLAAKLAE